MDFLGTNRTSLILYLLITVLVIALFVDGNQTFEAIELSVQDSMFRVRGTRPVSGNVQICALDDASLRELGWPVKRESLARLILGLRESGAAVIVCDFDWRNVAPPDSAHSDSMLLASLSGKDHVILPLQFTYADLGVSVPAPPQEYRHAMFTERFAQGSAVSAQALFGPEAFLADSATALGSITPMLERDRVVRWSPLMVDYGGYPFASSVLWAASLYADVQRTSWWIEPGEMLRMGPNEIPTDDRGRVLLDYYGPARSFTYHSARDFLDTSRTVGAVSGKIVVVGPTGFQGGIQLKSRATDEFPGAELTATAIENIVQRHFVRSPSYSAVIDLVVLGLIGLFCAVVLPKISLLYRFIVLGISLFVIVNMQYLILSSFGLLTHAFYPALEIVFFMCVSPMIQSRQEREEANRRGSRPTSRTAPAYTDARHPSTQPTAAPQPSLPTAAVDNQPFMATEQVSSPAGPSGTVRVPPAYPTSTTSGQSTRIETAAIPIATPSSGVVQVPPPVFSSTPSSGTAIPQPLDAQPETTAEPSTPAIEPVPEQYLGRYRIVEEIGRGAMGVVYKGIDPAINRPVALKTVRLDLAVPPAEKEELRGRLLREAQAAGQLSHPNIVTIYDVGSQGDVHYIAMEYLQGYTLERAVARNISLNYKIFAKLMIQVCDALEYAHSNELVHRDVKPANIMVLDNFKVKVMDFGIARVAHSNMTQTGVALGTPSYISPEQLSGHGVDRRSDIFSLGVVMYEILTKEKPFQGENLNKLIFAILNEKPRRPTDHDNNIPEAFNNICFKALEKEPAKRYQYALDLARDLKEFVNSLQPQKLTI